jgi:Caspase domain
MLQIVRVAIALLLLIVLPSAVWAQNEKRIALLIGNQSYAPEIGALANPRNDVELLERTLKGLGFEVAVERDAGLGALARAVNAYARRVHSAGPNAVGFFYYSGHGAQDGGTNYLIPVDVKTAETGELWDQSLQLTEITRKLKRDAGNATHFVVFDACRNVLKLKQAGTRAMVQSKGFVPVSQESGMLIAYATAEGELASDVGAGAGPYAKILSEEIVKPGVEAVYMFRRVQVRVRATIGQEPWLGFSALGEVHLAGLQAETPRQQAAPVPPQVNEAAEAWAAVKDTTNPVILEEFVKRYGDAFYATLARMRLDELKKAASLPSQRKTPANQPGCYETQLKAECVANSLCEWEPTVQNGYCRRATAAPESKNARPAGCYETQSSVQCLALPQCAWIPTAQNGYCVLK